MNLPAMPKWGFSPDISIGNVLTVVIITIMLLGFYTNFVNSFAEQRAETRGLTVKLVDMSQDLRSLRSRVEFTILDVEKARLLYIEKSDMDEYIAALKQVELRLERVERLLSESRR